MFFAATDATIDISNNRSKGGFSMKLTELIKFHREHAGLTQEALAEILSISRQSISKWENGTALPDVDNLIALADYFDLSLDELIRGSEHFPKPFTFGKILKRSTVFLTFVLPIIALVFLVPELFNNKFEALMILPIGYIGILCVLMIAPGTMAVYDEHWTITRQGILVQNITNPFQRIWRWLRILFTGKDDVAQEFYAYSNILAIEVRMSTRSLYGKYFYRYEYKAPGLTLFLHDGKVIYIDIPNNFEQYLLQALSYFREKKIEILDPHDSLQRILAENYLRYIDFYDYVNYDIDESRQALR